LKQVVFCCGLLFGNVCSSLLFPSIDRVRQILMFFLCTRFLCPLLISIESKNVAVMIISKELGAMVCSTVVADLDMLETVLNLVIDAEASPPDVTGVEFLILDAVLGLGVKVGMFVCVEMCVRVVGCEMRYVLVRRVVEMFLFV
jgi:hypothetical protein